MEMKRHFCVQPLFAFLFLLNMLFSQAEASVNQKAKWKGRIEDDMGIAVVKNPDKPIFDEHAVRFEEDLFLGRAATEEREKYQFSRISGIAVDKEEKIYVLDYTEAHVKVFDKNGQYLKMIGKKGQGPGEMASPFSVSITPNDEIMIQDLNNRRIIYLSLGGEFIKSLSTAEWIIVGSRTDSKGNIVAVVSNRQPDKQVIELKKFDTELNPIVSYRSYLSQRRSSAFNPFGPDISWTLTKNDYIICGYPENYELEVYDPEGNLIRKIHKDSKPVKVSSDEIEEAKKRLPGPLKLDIPKYHSAFRDLTADEEGRIYVRTWEKKGNSNGYYFDIFDSAGKFIVKIPLEFKPVVWKNEKVYVIEEDENGFQVVKRYKVSWDYRSDH